MVTLKRKAGVFKFLRLEEEFSKRSVYVCMMVGLTVENKAAFSIGRGLAQW